MSAAPQQRPSIFHESAVSPRNFDPTNASWKNCMKDAQTKVLTHRKCYSQPFPPEYDKCKTFHQLTSDSAGSRFISRRWMWRVFTTTKKPPNGKRPPFN